MMSTRTTTSIAKKDEKFVPDQTHLRIIEGIMDRVVVSVEKKEIRQNDDDDSDWSSTDEEEEEKNTEEEIKEGEREEEGEEEEEEEEEEEGETRSVKKKNESKNPITTKNEILPEIKKDFEFEILPSDKFVVAGTVFNVVRGSVIVVEGLKESEPLCSGTVLCTSDAHNVLGEIDELFGPVSHPYYIMRNVNQSRTDLVKMGQKVVAVSRTRTVVDARMRLLMQKERGTDASNINDEEAENQEFSDDEQEREFKKRTKRMLGKDKRKRWDSEGEEHSSSGPVMKPRRRYVHPRPQQHRPRPQQYHPHPQQYHPRPPYQLPYHLPPTQFGSSYQQSLPYGAAQQSYIPQQYQYGHPRPQYQPFCGGNSTSQGYYQQHAPPQQQQYTTPHQNYSPQQNQWQMHRHPRPS